MGGGVGFGYAGPTMPTTMEMSSATPSFSNQAVVETDTNPSRVAFKYMVCSVERKQHDGA